jgi:cytochrome c553
MNADRFRVFCVAISTLAASFAVAGDDRDSFAQRMRPCVACHGEQGRATPDGFFPRIAGKPAGYLFEQLLNFREGRRQHAEMSYLLDRQSDAYLLQMARHFAAIELPYPAPVSVSREPAVLALGEKLVRQGDAARDIPACSGCHGERLTGIEPAVPGLLGLPHDYLVAQIGSWREHSRKGRTPDCMAEIAMDLQPTDVEAVAAWLASQPVPTPSSPRHEPLLDPPTRCGSLEPRS